MHTQGPWLSLRHSGWTSWPRQRPQGIQGTTKHRPSGCFVPFKQRQGPLLMLSSFAWDSLFLPRFTLKHYPSFRVWLATSVTPKLTQLPPVQPPPVISSLHTAAHVGDRPSWGRFSLCYLLAGGLGQYGNLSVSLHVLIYELGWKHLPHRLLVRGKLSEWTY